MPPRTATLRRALVLAFLGGSIGVAHADDVDRYFAEAGPGVVIGYRPSLTALTLEGSLLVLSPDKTGDRMIGGMFHVLAAAGKNDNGSFTQIRIGLEGNSCIGGGFLCALVGVDIGYQHLGFVVTGGITRVTDPVLVPRAGVELGPPFLRFRAAIELPLYNDHDELAQHLRDQIAISFAVLWRHRITN